MIWFYLIIFVVSFLTTGLLRSYVVKKGMLDVPNSRSSHAIPTPRGGGLAIVFAMLAAMAVLAAQNGLSRPIIAMGVAGFLIAAIGFVDDRGHINARWRLLVHFAGAGILVLGLGGLPELAWLGGHADLGWVGHGLAIIGLVWLLNLYNFMDGIDGIAAAETLTTTVPAGCLLWLVSGPDWLVSLNWILAAAAAGFLVWNFPPAKIFMGDAGSGFLGLMAGALGLAAAQYDSNFLWAWLILLGVFIVDATVTLLRRLIQRIKVYEAHRTHAYQNASRKFGRHWPVTVAVIGINVLWLTPMAYLVVIGKLQGFTGVVIAYAPLLALAFGFSAGVPERTNSAASQKS